MKSSKKMGKCEKNKRESVNNQKSEFFDGREVCVNVGEIGHGGEKVLKLGLRFMEKYVKGSVNNKNIVFV